ncbi:hypothetical protein Tco_0432754 [Tanacetum coccineum]
MSDNIPFDIQMEIIKRVPNFKSLIRFRSVLKPWMAFIDSPEFIAYDVTFPQQQQDFSPNVSDLVKQLKDSTVIGSSCGLWCLHGYKNWPTEMLVIWNPSIRISVGIVVPFVSSFCKMTNFGFGVCPSTYDPTIVIISNLPGDSILRVTTQVAIGRFIYWFSKDWIVGNDGVWEFQNLILSYDLIAHEFKQVNLPVSIANQVTLDISISKLNESLVVSGYTIEVNDGLRSYVFGHAIF